MINYLSIVTHFENFAKGVLDSKDVVFYLSMIFFSLFMTSRSMESLRWRANMAAKWLKARQTKYSAYVGVYILVILAVLAAVNFLANRYDKSYDSTKNKQFSLSDQTIKIVKDLKNDVRTDLLRRERQLPERARSAGPLLVAVAEDCTWITSIRRRSRSRPRPPVSAAIRRWWWRTARDRKAPRA